MVYYTTSTHSQPRIPPPIHEDQYSCFDKYSLLFCSQCFQSATNTSVVIIIITITSNTYYPSPNTTTTNTPQSASLPLARTHTHTHTLTHLTRTITPPPTRPALRAPPPAPLTTRVPSCTRARSRTMTRQVNGKIVLRGQQQWGLPGNLLTLVEEEGEEKGDESKEVGEESPPPAIPRHLTTTRPPAPSSHCPHPLARARASSPPADPHCDPQHSQPPANSPLPTVATPALPFPLRSSTASTLPSTLTSAAGHPHHPHHNQHPRAPQPQDPQRPRTSTLAVSAPRVRAPESNVVAPGMMARQTRRSLSLAAEKENNVPQEEMRRKKQRQDAQSREEVASQPPKALVNRKRKKLQMEDDGFQFRAPRKSTRISNRQSLAGGNNSEPMTSSDPPVPPPPAKERPKKIPKQKLPPEEPPAPAPPKPAKTTKTKKPARRKDDIGVTSRPKSPPPHKPQQQDMSLEDSMQSTESTRIRLRTNDTPGADRKKPSKFRQSSAGARRSSVGLRGRRASSLIQDGIVAEPHPSIETKDYYKHINQDLMEFMRMQQLLTWCGHHVLNRTSAPPRSSDEAAARPIARVIQEEILKKITTNGTLSNWMARDISNPGPPVIKKPNPENEKNLKKLEELKEDLRRLDEEREAWKLLEEMDIDSLLAMPQEMDPMLRIPSSSDPAAVKPSSSTDPSTTTDPATKTTHPVITAQDLLNTPDSIRAQTLLSTSHDFTLKSKDVMTRHASELEFQVDQLADACHRVNMFTDMAGDMAGRMLETVERRLAERERSVRESAGTEELSTLEVLRSLARFSE
ncbi:hypothetical protein EX30DRAFT_363630 [Ascodesmis nigricans]|uniref:Uncharacterized protein n=1 Tax=Ascodesmis nigricans TaxID=341454 RepID=A0A4S2MY69_9PEZI|nr:hypothetical protein EX30DRAFT_363630 [Ascodesmis nigricans]